MVSMKESGEKSAWMCHVKEAITNHGPTRVSVDTPVTRKLTGKRYQETIKHKDGRETQKKQGIVVW